MALRSHRRRIVQPDAGEARFNPTVARSDCFGLPIERRGEWNRSHRAVARRIQRSGPSFADNGGYWDRTATRSRGERPARSPQTPESIPVASADSELAAGADPGSLTWRDERGVRRCKLSDYCRKY